MSESPSVQDNILPPALVDAVVPPAVREVVEGLQRAGHAAFLVGGCVRDLLRLATPSDFDIATSALPTQVQQAFRKVIPTGIEHGTVTVVSKGVPVEVTTFRTEGEYRDGRRPSAVSFHEDIEGDLSRRDFTINAIAFDPVQRRLVDPFGGQADLTAKVLRCVGDPNVRFAEDGLRTLRAVRFAAVLGFEIEPATRAAIPGAVPVFRKVAMERVREELTKLLLSTRPGLGLFLLEDTGLLAAFLSEALERSAERRDWVEATPAVLELRLTALLHGLAEAPALLARLKFPGKTIDAVGRQVLEAIQGGEGAWTDGELRRWIARTGPASAEAILIVADARKVPEARALLERVRGVLAAKPCLSARGLALRGEEIMAALAVGPSPVVGEATRYLLEQVLDDPQANTRERLLSLLASFRRPA